MYLVLIRLFQLHSLFLDWLVLIAHTLLVPKDPTTDPPAARSALRFNIACFMRVLSTPLALTPYWVRSQLSVTRSQGLVPSLSSCLLVWNYDSSASLLDFFNWTWPCFSYCHCAIAAAPAFLRSCFSPASAIIRLWVACFSLSYSSAATRTISFSSSVRSSSRFWVAPDAV